MKILICGHSRHGKDTFAEMLGIPFQSSSEAAMDHAIWPTIGKDYETKEQCFADRVNRRAEWFRLIRDYNTPDESRLCRDILSNNDIYVGLRSSAEFQACKHMFDMTIWVDASMRLPPEPGDSNELNRNMFGLVVSNNGDLDALKRPAKWISGILKSREQQQ